MTEWHEIKAAYVIGQMSLRELSDEFNVNYKTCLNKSCKESWGSERDNFRADLSAGIIAARKDAVILDRAGFDDLTDIGCDKILSLAITNLTEQTGTEDEKPTIKELDEVAALVVKLQLIKYRRLNVPAPKQVIENTMPAPVEGLPEEQIIKLVQEKLAVAMNLVPLTIESSSDNGKKDNGRDDSGSDGTD